MKFVHLLRFAVPFILGTRLLSAQLDQVTVIRDFAIPRFDEQGRRLSMLRGKELRRHSEEEATVIDMDLRTYAAARPDATETRLRSSSARFYLKDNRASSDQTIRIDGPDYEIIGQGWRWNGKERRVLIDNEVRVLFDATLTDFLESGCDPDKTDSVPPSDPPLRSPPKDEGQTRIHSDKLELLTTEKDHKFLFMGNVRIIGRNLLVTCNRLEVISTRSSDEKAGPGAFGSISNIFALGRVRIEQRQRSAVAGKATIDVDAGIITLEDDPVVFEDKGKISGHKIILYRGQRRVEVHGKPGETRAKVTLPPIRDLGALGKQLDEKKDDAKKQDSLKVAPPRKP